MKRGIAASALLLACHTGTHESEAWIDSDHVRLYYQPSEGSPCEGSAAYLSDVAERQAKFLGVPLPSRIEYHVVASVGETPCVGLDPIAGGGCTVNGSTIWATDPSLTHELVHAILIPQKGFSDPFFEEGIAVALGGEDQPGPTDDPPSYDASPADLFGQEPLPAARYGIAGDFVSYLVTTYGMGAFWQLLRAVPKPRTAEQVDSALVAVYGKGFQALVLERLGSGLKFANDRLSFPECSADVQPWTGEQWSISTQMGCDANAVGMRTQFPDLPGVAERIVPVDVAADGLYQMSIAARGLGRLVLRHCVSGTRLLASLTSQASTTYGISGQSLVVFAWLKAGRHYLALSCDSDVQIDVAIRLSPAPVAAGTCGAIEPLQVDGSTDGVYVAPAQDTGQPAVVAIYTDTQRTAALLAQAALQLCASACNPVTCMAARQNDTATLAPGNTLTLVARAQGPWQAAGLAFVH